MTSWVVTIDKKHPNHWAIAKQHGFWDLTQHRPIEAGDLVYFWQAGKSFFALTRPTTSAAPLQAGAAASWEDSGARQYASRIEFEVIDESPTSQPKWVLEVGPRLTTTPDLRSIPRFDDPDDEAVLASYFGTPVQVSSMDRRLQQLLSDAGITPPELDVDAMTKDQRDLVETFVALREGQQKFRKELLAAYGACAVTGTSVPRALDAAHISDYKGKQTQHVTNGILLRTDLHRLFDAKLMTVEAETYEFRVSPDLTDTPYGPLDRQVISLPSSPAHQPNKQVLKVHNAACAWLSA